MGKGLVERHVWIIHRKGLCIAYDYKTDGINKFVRDLEVVEDGKGEF